MIHSQAVWQRKHNLGMIILKKRLKQKKKMKIKNGKEHRSVMQNLGLAGTGSPEGQRPRAYILVSPHPCGNQKPRSGHQCLRQARVRLDLPISTTHRVRLTFLLRRLDVSLFFKQKDGCYSTKVLDQEQRRRTYIFAVSSTASFL